MTSTAIPNTHPIFDPTWADARLGEHFSAQLQLADELILYGADLLQRAMDSAPKSIAANSILTVLFRQCLTCADAGFLSLRNGVADAAMVHARRLFEARWGLMLAVQDPDKWGTNIHVLSIRETRHLALRQIPGSAEYEKYSEARQLIASATAPTDEAINILRETVAAADGLLERDNLSSASSNFDQAKARLEKRLADWGNDEDEGDDEEGASAKRGLSEKKRKKLLDAKSWERDGRLVEVANNLRTSLGDTLFEDYNVFRDRVDAVLKHAGIKLAAADLKQILKAVSWRVETASPVIAKVHKAGKIKADPLRGLFETTVDGKRAIVEYETDSDLRDTEQVPLLEEGGIEAFIRREVLPYTPDAWIKEDATKIGYEVSFTRHFYKPQPLRTLEEISADILAIEKEAEGLLDGLLKVAPR